MFFDTGLQFQVNQSSERYCNTGQQSLNEFYYYFLLTCELTIWQGFFFYKDMIVGFGNFLVLQG